MPTRALCPLKSGPSPAAAAAAFMRRLTWDSESPKTGAEASRVADSFEGLHGGAAQEYDRALAVGVSLRAPDRSAQAIC